ncbi:MAG TPA: superoxide dismutase [Bacteriovoracaceae bacterium]|nr:superoxide dismutase [Bacteriovoracaceae bacterium]
MEHKLPELPYPKNALEPHISAETMELHYEKHHHGYVTTLNELIKGSKLEHMPLQELILSSEQGSPVYNNAAQIWNHTFFWNCMKPQGGGNPTGKIEGLINKRWNSFEKFKEEFTKSATSNFGSGWTWLILDKQGAIEILNTSNAETPKSSGHKALLTLDVWEHAYYLDYRNERPKFIDAFWKLVNWDFVNQNI